MPSGRTRDRDKAKTDTLRKPVATLVESAEIKPADAETDDQHQITKGDNRPWFRHPAIILSILMLAAIIAQAVIFDFQWSAMQTAIDESKRTRELEYRAYVAAKGVTFTARPDNPAYGEIRVVTTNSGRTPGIGKMKVNFDQRANPLPEDTVINEPDQVGSKIVFTPSVEYETAVGVMGNKIADLLMEAQGNGSTTVKPQSKSQPVPDKLSPAPAVPSLIPPNVRPANAYTGTYVYGIIEYRDIFEKQHWTKFCFFNAPGTNKWISCPTFNDSN
jgi:hypothetical protein